MKRKFIMLSLLISGQTSENDIDVYLALLIEDLKTIWEEGVEVFDGYHQQNFNLRAILLWTINDFSAYENLSSYSVKGHNACLVCEEDTFSIQLKHERKTVYLGNWSFLPKSHHYQRLQKAFNEFTEERRAPKVLTGEGTYQRANHLRASYRKGKQNTVKKNV